MNMYIIKISNSFNFVISIISIIIKLIESS